MFIYGRNKYTAKGFDGQSSYGMDGGLNKIGFYSLALVAAVAAACVIPYLVFIVGLVGMLCSSALFITEELRDVINAPATTFGNEDSQDYRRARKYLGVMIGGLILVISAQLVLDLTPL